MAFPFPHIRPQRSWIGLVDRSVDALGILASAVVAAYLHPETRTLQPWSVATPIASVVLFSLVAEVTSLYRGWHGASVRRELACTVSTWGATALLLGASMVVYKPIRWSPGGLLVWIVLATGLLVSARCSLRRLLEWMRYHGWNTRRCAIVGVNPLAVQLARNLAGSPELGVVVGGFYDDRPQQRTLALPEDVGQRIGDLGELVGQARRGEVDMIYITFPLRAENRIRRVLDQLGDTTASVYIVPDLFVFELLHARWTDIGGLPVVSVFDHPFYGVDGIAKRCMDLVLATMLLFVLALPMAVVALLVKLSSPGPVFFRQRRYGLDGREIRVLKFRSMTVCEDGTDVRQAQRADPRVTPVGAVLRRTSIDELPQLFNVLAGSMSLVGPRPHATAHNELYRKQIQGYMLRHKIKPGITGLAQVHGFRGETDTLEKMQRRVEYDHRYIREWSLWLDWKILLRTVHVVFARQNAY